MVEKLIKIIYIYIYIIIYEVPSELLLLSLVFGGSLIL